MPLLARGLVPRRPSSPGELLMIISLVGIVMAGSGTIRYSAWMEEREMGLLGHVRQKSRWVRCDAFQPRSDQEVRRMLGWLRVNRINIVLTYLFWSLDLSVHLCAWCCRASPGWGRTCWGHTGS